MIKVNGAVIKEKNTIIKERSTVIKAKSGKEKTKSNGESYSIIPKWKIWPPKSTAYFFSHGLTRTFTDKKSFFLDTLFPSCPSWFTYFDGGFRLSKNLIKKNSGPLIPHKARYNLYFKVT
ncbi:MAG: hypothetical protein PVH61_07245 [Candidatus Aminicenantes bacterium]|jgi:hypothetical protein